MTSGSLEASICVDRRSIISGMLSVTTSSIAGCGEFQNTDQHDGKAAVEANDSSNRKGHQRISLQQAERDIEKVFDQLSNLPIFESDDFVFDVKYFENEFDHREAKRTAETAIERLEEITTGTVSESRIEWLIDSAKIGRLLVAQ